MIIAVIWLLGFMIGIGFMLFQFTRNNHTTEHTAAMWFMTVFLTFVMSVGLNVLMKGM